MAQYYFHQKDTLINYLHNNHHCFYTLCKNNKLDPMYKLYVLSLYRDKQSWILYNHDLGTGYRAISLIECIKMIILKKFFNYG